MYSKDQLLNLRNSPLAQGRPKDLGTIPGVTTDTPPLKSQFKRSHRSHSDQPKQYTPTNNSLKFQFITRVSGLDGAQFQENYMAVNITSQGIPVYQKRI